MISNQSTLTKSTYLTFKLGREFFASDVGKVLNILEMTQITEVPMAPSYMKGVINLRGTVLPVIDTRIKFGMSETEITPGTAILVLNVNVSGHETKLGALVDEVDEVIELEVKDIQDLPEIGTKYKSEFIAGMAQKELGFIMILNMDKVFSKEEIVQLNELKKENQTV